jgi:hypothetical protein
MISHATTIPHLYFYVDTIEKVHQTYKIKGWVGSTEKKIMDIRVPSGKSILINKDTRNDVLDVYPFMDIKPGFHLEINEDEIDKKIVVICETKEVYAIDSLLKWSVYHNGFNRDNKDLIVVDNFYSDPDLIRDFAMKNLTYKPSNYHKGSRATDRFILDGTKEKFEEIIGRNITNWNHESYANGIFQYCTADQPIVYHIDTQQMAAVVFLTPNAPVNTGTSFYKSKVTGSFGFDENERMTEVYEKTFKGTNKEMNFYDDSHFEKVDEVGNVFNRLVIWDATRIHAASKYFGDDIENARFFHLFFFDLEK